MRKMCELTSRIVGYMIIIKLRVNQASVKFRVNLEEISLSWKFLKI